MDMKENERGDPLFIVTFGDRIPTEISVEISKKKVCRGLSCSSTSDRKNDLLYA